jgi:hypothetical protein
MAARNFVALQLPWKTSATAILIEKQDRRPYPGFKALEGMPAARQKGGSVPQVGAICRMIRVFLGSADAT